ncbi:MAG: hypothetical protein OXF41_09910 [bacterium]|nr:hypothetical protein [bacterium]
MTVHIENTRLGDDSRPIMYPGGDRGEGPSRQPGPADRPGGSHLGGDPVRPAAVLDYQWPVIVSAGKSRR